MSEKITKLKYKKNGIIETIYPVTHVDAIVGNMMLSKVVNVVASTAQTNLWGNPIRYKVPQTSSGNTSIVMLINAENTSSAGSEKYLGIMEMNILATGSNQTNGSNLNWLVVHGFEKENFHLRHLKSADEILLWVKPTVGNLTITILSETTNGVATNDAILVDKPALTTVTSTTIVGDKLSDSQFLGLNNTISGSKVTGKLADGVEAVTQSVGDNSDKVATTKYVDQSTPKIKTLHSKSLLGSGNVTLNASDVGARPANWTPSWSQVSGKPTTFSPSTHSHPISQITGLQTALDGKVDKKQSVNGMDMNNVTETGFYYGYNMTNAAVTTISTFMVINYSPDWIIQKQFVPASGGNREFIRSRHSGTTWSAWTENPTKDWVTSNTRSNTWTPSWSQVSGKPSAMSGATIATAENNTAGNTIMFTTPWDLKEGIMHLTRSSSWTPTWAQVTGKPTWIGSSKPSYNLGEIAETTTYKRVTQSEKDTWNAKQNALGYTPENTANKRTSIRTSGATNTAYVSELGVKNYVDSMIGSVYRPAGDWNANTNSPTLANNTPANAGKVYRVSVAGTRFGFTFAVGDKLAFNESGVISKWDNVDDVTSVAGKTGAVVLTASDVGARPATWTPTASEVGARPSTWKPTWSDVTGKPSAMSGATIATAENNADGNTIMFTTPWDLKEGIMHLARPSSWTPTWAQVTGKPSWIGSSKPSYNLGEISETTTYKRFTQTEKTKLNGIEAGAQVNPYSKSQLDNKFNAKANDNEVVKITGAQTISGVKTFNSPTTFGYNTGHMLEFKSSQNQVYMRTSSGKLMLKNDGMSSYSPIATESWVTSNTRSSTWTPPTISSTNIKSSTSTTAGLITGQRLKEGVEAVLLGLPEV